MVVPVSGVFPVRLLRAAAISARPECDGFSTLLLSRTLPRTVERGLPPGSQFPGRRTSRVRANRIGKQHRLPVLPMCEATSATGSAGRRPSLGNG